MYIYKCIYYCAHDLFVCVCVYVHAYMCLYMCNNIKIIIVAISKHVHDYNLLQSHNSFYNYLIIYKFNIITILYFQIILQLL
jgi:hypothetical protein